MNNINVSYQFVNTFVYCFLFIFIVILFCLFEDCKIIMKKENSFTNVEIKKRDLNSLKTDLAKHICVNFGKSEFLNMHIFNWYKDFYSACSNICRYLDFIKAIGITSCSFQHGAFVTQAAISS